MTNEDRRAKPEDRSAFTPEVRERLGRLHNVYANRDGAGPARTADDIWTALVHIDALEARVAELEGKALAYDDAMRGDFNDRAHALAKDVRGAWGRNVWHVAVELAEQNKARVAELDEAGKGLLNENVDLAAKVAVLAAECRAWRLAHEAASPDAFAGDMERIGHAEDAYELMHRSIDVMMEVTRAATDANGGLDG